MAERTKSSDDGNKDLIFKVKDKLVDWAVILPAKESKLLQQLWKADIEKESESNDSGEDSYEKCADLLKQISDLGELMGLASCNIDPGDASVNTDNLIFLFHLAQSLMEIKNFKLTESRQKLKECEKKLREKEGSKGDPSTQKRKEQEIENRKEENKLLKDEVLQLTRELSDCKAELEKEKEKSQDHQDEISRLEQIIRNLTGRNKELEKTSKDEEQKHKDLKMITRRCMKLTEEVTELATKLQEVEQERDHAIKERDELTDDILEHIDESKDLSAQLENSEHLRRQLEEENRQLQEKIGSLTLEEEQNEKEQEALMAKIAERCSLLDREINQYKRDLQVKGDELKEAKAAIAQLQVEKRQSEVERRFEELQAELQRERDERTADLDMIVQVQKENTSLKGEIKRLEENRMKQQKRIQAQFKEKENEIRSHFFEKQESMMKTEILNSDLQKRLAELEDENMQQEQTIVQLEKGIFGLPEAMAKIREIKGELDEKKMQMSERTKGFNEAVNKIEALHDEVVLLRNHLVKVDPSLKQIEGMIGFLPISADEREMTLEWRGQKDGFKLDISACKVRTAMELERAKAMNLQLEREVEALEMERLDMKSQLRLLALQKGERAAKLGLSAEDIEKLDSFAEYLKSGDPMPFSFAPTAGENNQARKLGQRVSKLEKDLKDKGDELAAAHATIQKLKDDAKSDFGTQKAVEDLKVLVTSMADSIRFSEGQEVKFHELEQADDSIRRSHEGTQTTPARQSALRFGQSSGFLESSPAILTPHVLDQLAKAIREGELTDQANVGITFKAVRCLPNNIAPRIYATVVVNRSSASSKIYPVSDSGNSQSVTFSKDEIHRVAVGHRENDLVSICLYEANAEGKQDRSRDRFIGKVESLIETWGRSPDKTWSGSLDAWLPLQDNDGKYLYGGSNSRQKCEINVQLKFVEAASKRAQVLEEQLEALKEASMTKSRRLECFEKDLEGLRDDLRRKNEDLEHITAERNKMRQELHQARLNSGFTLPHAAQYAAMVKVASERGTGPEEPELWDSERLVSHISDLNAHLIEALDNLSKREDEVRILQEELHRYSEGMSIFRVQLILLYREHHERVSVLENEAKKYLKEWKNARDRGDLEANKASSTMEKLINLSRLGANSELQHAIDAERKVIVLESERDELVRASEALKHEHGELRVRYDSLILDMARQQHRLKQRLGRLERARSSLEWQLNEKESNLDNSVSKQRYDSLLEEHLILKDKYSLLVNEGSKTLLEQNAVQGQKQRADKQTKEKEELQLQLKEAADRAGALSCRLEMLSLKDAPSDRKQLIAQSEIIVKLEVSERNFSRRYEMCIERLRGAEQERGRMEERISFLEQETVEKTVLFQRLQERERELQGALGKTIPVDKADELRAQVTAQEREIFDLKLNCQKFEEIAELASDQARAMEDLQSIHKDELESLRAFSLQVQAESETGAELGILHRKIIDRDSQIREMNSKITGLDRELSRLDSYIVRLDERLESKEEELAKSMEARRSEVGQLRATIDELRIRAAGQIPLDKADEWAASLRELTGHKQAAIEELATSRKGKVEAEQCVEILQIELEDQRRLLSQLRDEHKHEAVGSYGSTIDKFALQADEMTKLKVENVRLLRQLKQLQERESYLETTCQQGEREIRHLEEALVRAQSDSDTRFQHTHSEHVDTIAVLQSKISALERSGPGSRVDHGRAEASQVLQPAPIVAANPQTSLPTDFESITAMRDKINQLTHLLREKELEIDALKLEFESARASAAREDGEFGDGSKLAIAAEHTQEVARLTIERLEKNNERKTGLILKYQQQLREAREEYMNQKELDANTIEELRGKLATKINESIHHMRGRVQGSQPHTVLSGAAAEEADAIFAEKDKLISALSDDLKLTKERLNETVQDRLRESEEAAKKIKIAEEESENLRQELQRRGEERPRKQIESLVQKLRLQLAEKEKKQKEMKAAIESLREEMVKTAETKSKASGAASESLDEKVVQEAAEILRQEAEKLKNKLERARVDQTKWKKELEEERDAKEKAKKEAESEKASRERVESELARTNRDLKRALKEKRDAQEALKALEDGAVSDKKRIDDIERQVKEADKAKVGKPGRSDADKERAMRQWESEKRLEVKVEDLREKLREQRKELDTIEKQHAIDLEKAGREAERLRQQIDKLEQDKKSLRAQLRGGEGIDSEELLKRVREAERSLFEAQEQNEKLNRNLEVEGREKESASKLQVSALEKTIKELKEGKDALAQQLQRLVAGDQGGFEKERAGELRRLEDEVARLRDREDELERELLGVQNQVLRLRFEDEHAALRLQRWRRRVRELESLPLAAGRAVTPESLQQRAKSGKEEEDMERFVRSTKVALERLHRDNEALRANSGSNVRYMELVRENKLYKANLADREKEMMVLNEKMARLKEQADKRNKAEEKCHSLERQLREEADRADGLGNRLRDRERQVSRLEADLRVAREARPPGGDGEDSGAARLAAELDAVEGRLRASERQRAEAEAELGAIRRELSAAQKRAVDLEAQASARSRALHGGTAAGGTAADAGEGRELREQVRKLQAENEELKAELDSFDPAFFDEIEDLKYNHNEMTKLVEKYEALLQQLAVRYGFDFTPPAATSRPAARGGRP